MDNFGTSTKKYVATCSSGHEVILAHPAIRTDASPIVHALCDDCGARFFSRLPRLDGKPSRKLSQSTINKQLGILELFEELGPPMTVRQVFYAMSVRNMVPKDEKGYRQAQYQLAEMRREGTIPYGWIADNTRTYYKPRTDSGMRAALERMKQAYRRDLWAEQDAHVEIWIEKDALAGVVRPVTAEFDVPLYVARGYGSMSFTYEAAEDLKEQGKPCFVYHFGDFDPSGVDAAYKIQEALEAHGAEFYFERVAVTEEQIARYNLPTRPTKKQDPRAKNWGDKPSVELDAIPPQTLRSLVQKCIYRHMDHYEYERLRKIEEVERESFDEILKGLPPAM